MCAIEQATAWALPRRHAALSVVTQLIKLHDLATSKKVIPYFTVYQISSMRGVKNRNAATEIINQLEELRFITRFGHSKCPHRDPQGRYFRWGRIFTFNLKAVMAFLHRTFGDEWKSLVGRLSLVRADLVKDYQAFENELARRAAKKTKQDEADEFFGKLGDEIAQATAAVSTPKAVSQLKEILKDANNYPTEYRLTAIDLIKTAISEHEGYQTLEDIEYTPKVLNLDSIMQDLSKITRRMPLEVAVRRLETIQKDIDKLESSEDAQTANLAIERKVKALKKPTRR